MTGQDGMATSKDEWVRSICYMCYFCACAIKVHRVNGTVVKIEGDAEGPYNLGRLCAKGNAGLMSLYDPTRVKVPLARTNPAKGIGVDPKWREISWDEALECIADRLRKVRQDDPRKLAFLSFDIPAMSSLVSHAFCSAFGTQIGRASCRERV